jgi:4-amino-4-deoxy-L-arabinose transferase-like glycosyltransferase
MDYSGVKIEKPPLKAHEAVPTKWLGMALVTLMIALSVVPRVRHLHAPLLESFGFRQTQTAITVRSLLEDGFSFLHAKTPIFGPPWMVPMEFPIFQLTAAALIRSTGVNIDVGCRLTSILFFYLSAAILFLIASHCFQNSKAGLCVLGVYLWSPFTILWSRTSMIEFAPIAFGLAYVYCLIKWFASPKQFGWVLAGMICGSIAALAKITSLAAMAPVLAVFSLAFLWREFNSTEKDQRLRLCLRRLSVLILFAAIPLVVGMAWVWYSDQVKNASPLTAWLTSSGLSGWNYGTLHQRLAIKNWFVVVSRIFEQMLPFGTMLLPILGVGSLFTASWPTRCFLVGMLLGAVLPVLIFFNLFLIHDYYLCAIAPCMAVLSGYGVFTIAGWLGRGNWFGISVFATGLMISWLLGYDYLRTAYNGSYHDPIVELAQAVEKITPSGKYVLVADDDWNSDILYYSNRRGCMLRDESIRESAAGWLPLNQFTTLVTQHRDDSALKWYRSHEMLMEANGYYIFRVSDPIPTSNNTH